MTNRRSRPCPQRARGVQVSRCACRQKRGRPSLPRGCFTRRRLPPRIAAGPGRVLGVGVEVCLKLGASPPRATARACACALHRETCPASGGKPKASTSPPPHNASNATRGAPRLVLVLDVGEVRRSGIHGFALAGRGRAPRMQKPYHVRPRLRSASLGEVGLHMLCDLVETVNGLVAFAGCGFRGCGTMCAVPSAAKWTMAAPRTSFEL